jgi:hypothetical protein
MQNAHEFNCWIPGRSVALLPAQRDAARLYRGDAHGESLNDVNFEAPFSVRETLRASSALTLMKEAGIRAALVTQGMNDGQFHRICGLATARGMQRELLARWEPALAVADVMTVWEDVSVVHWDSVCSLTTRQLHEMFRGTGLSHVVVVDHAEESQMHVKALLSRTALAQRLGH